MKKISLCLSLSVVLLTGCVGYAVPYHEGPVYGSPDYGSPAYGGSVVYRQDYPQPRYRDQDRDGIPDRRGRDRDRDGVGNRQYRRPVNPYRY